MFRCPTSRRGTAARRPKATSIKARPAYGIRKQSNAPAPQPPIAANAFVQPLDRTAHLH